ncbi:MAG: hypothetical protein WC313_01420 [Candidatus Kapaibacterium sp.]
MVEGNEHNTGIYLTSLDRHGILSVFHKLYELSRRCKFYFLLVAFIIISNHGCTNPFAPGLADNMGGEEILGDQRTVEGVFQNFRYAYLFKDTLVYGSLLNDDFRFIFRDFDKGIDESWGRDEDMRTTYRLFQATQSLDLNWNDVVNSIGDTLIQDISRGFNLTVIFTPTDVVTIFGRVNLRITRTGTDSEWRISQWKDESNF